MELRENILLIAGTGQNVGKTLFACKLIDQLKDQHTIISIKICPHFHELKSETLILKKTENFIITKETTTEYNKDSNRMLKAGSDAVYFVQTKDEYLSEVLSFFDKFIKTNTPVIIESGGLRELVTPGLFLMLKSNNQTKPKTEKHLLLADREIEFNGDSFNFDPALINFASNKWVIKN